ncbi:hypothetical protein ACJMK2_003791 [Sinanodonta woodiana]|uniref:Uncharacterized protein n=1 Tax=Sinanodonta woodiana TaxID=1069815 RepID=A0ABD3XZA2_SINWO
MRFPPSGMLCGHTFTDLSEVYIIAGDVGSDGILSSDMCQYMRVFEEVYEDPVNEALLLGLRNPSCGRGDS